MSTVTQRNESLGFAMIRTLGASGLAFVLLTAIFASGHMI